MRLPPTASPWASGAITEEQFLIQSNPAGLASSIMGVLGLASFNQPT